MAQPIRTPRGPAGQDLLDVVLDLPGEAGDVGVHVH